MARPEITLRKVRKELWAGRCPTCGQEFEAKYEGQVLWQIKSHMERHKQK